MKLPCLETEVFYEHVVKENTMEDIRVSGGLDSGCNLGWPR